MSLSARYRRASGFVLRRLADGPEPLLVLVPVRSLLPPGGYLLLLDGPVAQQVWEDLAEFRAGDELVRRVLAEFAVARAQAETDVAEFLRQLQELEAVEVQPALTPPDRAPTMQS